MAIIDDLRGILGEEAIAKIEGNTTLKSKLLRGDELTSLLDDGTVPPELKRTEPGAGLSLEDLTKTLNTSLGEFETRFTPKIDERIKAVTEPLVQKFTSELSAASARAAELADTMSTIRQEHRENFNEPFEAPKLNAWVKEQQEAGRNFGNVREAYEAWTHDRKWEAKLAAAREEGKRDVASSQHVPGVSSPAATGVRAKLRSFHAGTETGKTRTEILDEKLAALDARSTRVA
jgi:hypothetical protein